MELSVAIYLEDITEIRNKYAMILTQKEALLLQTGGHHTQQNLNWNRHEDTAHRRVGTLHIQMEGFLSDVDTETGVGTPHKILRKSLVVGWCGLGIRGSR